MTTDPTTDARARYGGWAFIAGASAGLGAAFATESARQGFDVALLARRGDLLEETAATIREAYGVQTRCIVADLAHDDIRDIVASATGDLDVGVVIYNAAAELYGPFLDLGDDAHRTNLAVNCFTRRCSRRTSGPACVIVAVARSRSCPPSPRSRAPATSRSTRRRRPMS
jgi:NADP-dependent 3-hydroxy acid dehydrogenase YdfG